MTPRFALPSSCNNYSQIVPLVSLRVPFLLMLVARLNVCIRLQASLLRLHPFIRSLYIQVRYIFRIFFYEYAARLDLVSH